MNFHETSIRSYLAECKSNEELQRIQEFSVDIIKGIKNGDDEAFTTFLELKDVKMCINKITGNIHRKFDNVTVESIKNELNVLIFNFIKNNYRTYHQPNEIQMLLVSMYGWLGGKAASKIYDNIKPKKDDYLGCWDMEEKDLIAEIEFKITIQQLLNEEEYQLFRARYEEDRTLSDIADELGITYQAVHKREKALLEKLKQLYI